MADMLQYDTVLVEKHMEKDSYLIQSTAMLETGRYDCTRRKHGVIKLGELLSLQNSSTNRDSNSSQTKEHLEDGIAKIVLPVSFSHHICKKIG